MNIEWYPGHMTKARRQMQEDLKLIDLIIEIRDARIPYSSQNPDLAQIGQNKLRLVILNKADLADPKRTEAWIQSCKEDQTEVIAADSKNPKMRSELLKAFERASAPKRERDRRRGLKNRPVRAMIVGIPNVGKSTFINLITKKSLAKTGNKPGVTRGKQWIHTGSGIDLLDTPGVLWPKFESEEVGLHLAMCGAIADTRIPMEELAVSIIEFMKSQYSGVLHERYHINEDRDNYDILKDAARERGLLLPGGGEHTERMAEILLNEFRTGKLGRITLELPEERQDGQH